MPVSVTSVRLHPDSLPHWGWAPPSQAGNSTSGTCNGNSGRNEKIETRSFIISIAGCKSYFSHQATHTDTTLNPPQHTDKQHPDGTRERQRNFTVWAHCNLGKNVQIRGCKSSDTSDKRAFEWACSIAATLLLLISARTAMKKKKDQATTRKGFLVFGTDLAGSINHCCCCSSLLQNDLT